MPILANTIEPLVCRGDAALCQITLTTCYHHHHRRRRRHHHRNPLHSSSCTQGIPISKINDSTFKAKCLGSSEFRMRRDDGRLTRVDIDAAPRTASASATTGHASIVVNEATLRGHVTTAVSRVCACDELRDGADVHGRKLARQSMC